MSNQSEVTHAEKSQSSHQGFEGPESELGGTSQFKFADNRPESAAQLQRQNAANDSPQVQQLKSLQNAVNGQPIQRQEIEGHESTHEEAEAVQTDVYTAALSDPEKVQIRQWRTTNVIGVAGMPGSTELTADADHNARVITEQLFLNRYVANDYQLKMDGTDQPICLAPEIVLADPRVASLRAHVNRLGPIVDWTDVSRGDRQVHVMEQLIDVYDYPVNGAAGLVGNLMAESTVQPNRIEGSREATPMRSRDFDGDQQDWTPEQIRDRNYSEQEGPRRPGIGLAQWTSPGRRDGLFDHTYESEGNDDIQGVDILFSMDAQVDYLDTELQGSYRGVYNVLTADGVSVNDAADDVVYRFEIPGAILTDTTPRRKRPRTDPNVQAVFAERRALAASALRAYRAVHPADE